MKNIFACGLILMTLLIISCDKDEPVVPIEPEVITTLNYRLISDSDGSEVVLSFVDLDGPDGNDPVVTTGTLKANDTYSGELELLNESLMETEDITEEIREEDEEHQFFFQTTISGMSVSYADQDMDGNPVGLLSQLTTGDAGEGTLTINLIHEPQKDAANVSAGDITNAGGESDIEVTFTLDVE